MGRIRGLRRQLKTGVPFEPGWRLRVVEYFRCFKASERHATHAPLEDLGDQLVRLEEQLGIKLVRAFNLTLLEYVVLAIYLTTVLIFQGSTIVRGFHDDAACVKFVVRMLLIQLLPEVLS